MGENYTTGFTPLSVNPTRVIEVKLLNSINAGNGSGGGGGGGVGSGGLSGSGPPTGVANATAAGVTYTDVANPSVPNFWISTAAGTANWVELIGS
jgi:hypothetical protein